MGKIGIIVLGVVLFLLLGIFSIYYYRPIIESDLAGRANTALQQAGIAVPELEFSGRDATLRGTVASAAVAAQAESLVADVYGVRVVRNELDVAAVETPTLTVLFREGETVLQGMLADSTARSNFEAQLRGIPDGPRLLSELTVSDQVSRVDWLESIAKMIAALQGDLRNGRLLLKGAVLELEGALASAEQVARLEATVRQFLPPALSFKSSLTVATPEPAAPAPTTPAPAPTPATPPVAALQRALAGAVVYFDFDSALLSSEARQTLDDLSGTMRQYPQANVGVHGHTDAMGTPAYNLRLSMMRAAAVKAYLAQQGVEQRRLKVKGFGEDKPSASNVTEAGRQQNRRVDFVLLQED